MFSTYILLVGIDWWAPPPPQTGHGEGKENPISAVCLVPMRNNTILCLRTITLPGVLER